MLGFFLSGGLGSLLGAFIIFAIVVVLMNAFAVVGGAQVAVLERRWFGSNMPL
jgi:hypothetical protein